jgi:ABC-2 type transport system permease protein
MRAFANHLAYDFRSALRDRGRLLLFHLFPLAYFALCGSFMTAVNPFFRQAMLPGMVLFAVMSAALLAAPSALVQARENGVFRSYRINGVPSASILSVPVVGAALHVAVVSLAISLAGAFVFGGRTPASAAGFAAAALLSYAAYAALGVLIGVAAGKDASAILVSQLIFVPSIMLGGLMVPARMMPEGLQRIALVLPSTHCMRAFAGLGGMNGGAAIPWASLLVLGSSAVLSFGLALALFEWDSRANRPSRKALAAILGIVPYAVAALVGV